MVVRREANRGIGHLFPTSPSGIGTKNQKNLKSAALIPINWFNLALTLYFPLSFILHNSQVRCSVVMQWRICSSLMSAPLICLQRQVAKLASGLFYCCCLLHNNDLATDLQRFTSNYGRRRCAACDCWTQTLNLAKIRVQFTILL